MTSAYNTPRSLVTNTSLSAPHSLARMLQIGILVAAPFAAMLAFDLGILGRSYLDNNSGDNLQLYFALAFTWLHSQWEPLSHVANHQPGMPLELASILFLLLNGTPTTDLSSYSHFALCFNAATILVVAGWTAWIAVRHDLPTLPIVLAACLTAVMPGISSFATTLVAYYTYGLLLLPIGVGLFATFSTPERDATVEVLTLAGLGFALTVSVVAGILIVSLVTAVSLMLLDRTNRLRIPGLHDTADRGGLAWLGNIALAAFLFANASFALRGIVWILSSSPGVTRSPPVYIASYATVAVAVVAAMVVLKRLSWLAPYMALGRPIAIGWLAGANILFMDWPLGTALGLLTRGGNAPHSAGFWDKLRMFDPWPFFEDSAWHVVLPALLAVAVWMLVRAGTRRSPVTVSDKLFGVMIMAVVGLDVATTLDISFVGRQAEYFISSSRFHMSVVAMVPVALLWLNGQNTWSWWFSASAASGVALATLIQYPEAVAETTAKANERERDASALVDQFLASDSDGTVLCYGTYIPHQCSFTHALWRVTLMNAKVSGLNLESRQIRPITSTTGDMRLPDHLEALPDGPVLLLIYCKAPEIPGRSVHTVREYQDNPSLFIYEIDRR